MQRTRGAIAWVMVGVVLMAGCGADPDDSQRAAIPTVAPTGDTVEPNGEVVDVLAMDNNFLPQSITIVAGTEVRWTNNGRNDHNVVPEGDPKAVTWGVLDAAFKPTKTYSRVFTAPGTYVYYCSIHGTAKAAMFGTVVVTAP